MFIIKNNYYLYIENIKDFDIDSQKNNKKINIILKNLKNNKLSEIIEFKKKCKLKKFKIFIANNLMLAKKCNADGLYISAYNKKIYLDKINKIGSAHNLKEISEKLKQKCRTIIVSRLFKTDYPKKKSYLGVLKFNLLIKQTNQELCPLGGIRSHNLLKLRLVGSKSLALLSEVKKKPTISSRLF